MNEQQIVLAAEITNNSTDFSQLAPIVDAVLRELARAGIPRRPDAIAADAGYWNEQQMDEVVADKHIPVLVAPDKGSRDTPKRWLTSGRATWMRALLQSEDGRERYGNRKQTVEPLYGDTKHNRGFTRFHRRGRMNVRTEFRLLIWPTTSPRSTATNSPPQGPENGPYPATPGNLADPLLTTHPPPSPHASRREPLSDSLDEKRETHLVA